MQFLQAPLRLHASYDHLLPGMPIKEGGSLAAVKIPVSNLLKHRACDLSNGIKNYLNCRIPGVLSNEISHLNSFLITLLLMLV